LNGKIIGITAVDYDDVSFNKNGVYKVESFLNANRFWYQLDSYSFDDMRIRVIDYSRYRSTQRVQNYLKNAYNLSFIKTDDSRGLLMYCQI
jgi:hypothetical protein